MQEERVTKYHFIKIQGSTYEGGKQLGKLAKKNETLLKMLTSLFPGQEKMTSGKMQKTMELFEQICPGITDEIQGFADEALEFYRTIKGADYRNYIIMDAEGNSALIEAAASNYSIKRPKAGSIPFLFATNHYESQQLKQAGFYTPNHSKLRYRVIKEFLQKLGARVSNRGLKELLASPMPQGVCCHYYEDGMGTMWSMIFHPEEKSVEVCFGSADQNEWRTFYLCDGNETDSSIKEYKVMLHNQKASADFWKEGDGNEL